MVIHTVKGFGIVNEADVFLEFSCFFYAPMDDERSRDEPDGREFPWESSSAAAGGREGWERLWQWGENKLIG